MRGGQVNGGVLAALMAFSLAGVHRHHQLDCPWKPFPEKLPLEAQPIWVPPGFHSPSSTFTAL